MTLPGGWSRGRVYALLTATIAIGAVLRVIACALDEPLHPDEYFQYLEPAWWHVSGVGLAAWEWQEGLRSWVLPSYNGAWMALLMRLGVHHGSTIGWFIKGHWAVLNASLVVIAWRGGCSLSRRLQRSPTAADSADPPSGFQGGLMAAALCASFPLLIAYSGHTLSEMPSMLCLLAGLVIICELTERTDRTSRQLTRSAACAGALLSLSACLRIATGPLVLVGPLWLLVAGHKRQLLPLLGGAVLPALAFGLVDLLTWGTFAGSFIEYVRFNFIEGGAADFGTEPAGWYLDIIRETLPLTLPLLLIPALLGLRATWPFVASAAFLIAFLSTQPHKEERFILAFWPLLLIAAGAWLGTWLGRARLVPSSTNELDNGTQRSTSIQTARWVRAAVPAVVLVALFVDGGRKFIDREESWLDRDRHAGQAWVGRQADLTGLLVEEPVATAGGLWLGSPAPQLPLLRKHLSNPLFSHALVRAGSKEDKRARKANFRQIQRFGPFRVLRRQPEQPK